MTAAARRAHLLALAYEAEREADHHFTEQEYDEGKRYPETRRVVSRDGGGGEMRFIDLTGQRFGRLTLLNRAENTPGGKTRFRCKCDCGNESVVQGTHLRSGHTESCGCVRQETSAEHMRNVRRKTYQRGYKLAPFTDEHRQLISKGRLRWADRNAKGVCINSNGYAEFTRGEHKGRGVHDVIVERIIGRRLAPDEVVHHRDENRSNNHPSNLELMTRADHTRHHEPWSRKR